MKKAIIFDLMGTLYDPWQAKLYTGVIELLEKLKKNSWQLFLVSTGSTETRKKTVEALGIAHFFTEMVFVYGKTPEIFSGLVKKHGLNPEETYVVGDMLHSEIEAGKKAGLKTIWINEQSPTQIQKANLVIKNINELGKKLINN